MEVSRGDVQGSSGGLILGTRGAAFSPSRSFGRALTRKRRNFLVNVVHVRKLEARGDG